MSDQPVMSEEPTIGGEELDKASGAPEPTPAPVDQELSPKDKAEQAIVFLEKWHENDERFRRRIDEIRAYIARLEGVKAGRTITSGVASMQPGPELFPKEEPPAPEVKFGSKSRR